MKLGLVSQISEKVRPMLWRKLALIGGPSQSTSICGSPCTSCVTKMGTGFFLNSWNKGSCWQVPSNELYCFAGWGPSTWFWAMHLQWLRPCDSLSWRKITRSSHSTHHLRKHAGMQRKFTVASPWVLKTSASIGSSIYSLRVCE